MINYDGRKFITSTNTDNGEVSAETIFEYHQKEDLVWAEYKGGTVRFGYLIAKVDENSCLDMRYHHINQQNELMTGICFSQPEILPNGKLKMYEEWQWTCKDNSKGKSILKEL